MSALVLDRRVGSADLETPLRQLGIPVEVATLDYGDAQVIGRGVDERPVLVGVEIKKVDDLIQSLFEERLTGHQLPGMLAIYERSYLLVEGLWTAGRNGELLIWKGKGGSWTWKQPGAGELSYMTFTQRLLTIGIRHGVEVVYTGDRRGTAAWLGALWRWWSTKREDQHNELRVLRLKDLEPPDDALMAVLPERPTGKMKVAAQLISGIGWTKAKAVGQHFRSIKKMVNAPKSEWQKVDGIGPKLATEIVAEIERES